MVARKGAVLSLGVLLVGGSLVFCGAPRNVGSPPPPIPRAAAGDAEPVVAASSGDAGAPRDPFAEEERARWAPIDAAIQSAIAEGKLPGCVVSVGRHDDLLFERAYGARAVAPSRVPMTLDTVFDLASLTKPIATATSILILAERGLVSLDARASTYVPELAKLPAFTVRQLLVHTSGLPAATSTTEFSEDRAYTLGKIAAISPKYQPGERFVYSDIGFIVLEEIVRRVSGKDLAAFAASEIFAPLGMKETGFLPPPELRARAAPTEERDGGFIQGDVHDPRAFAMGGVAGHAGLFSTARDLARFARAMLGRGALDGRRIFSDKTFERLLTRHDTPKGGRALGWDLDSTFASHRSPLLSKAAIGHGGYTGTALWIDVERDLYVLFLSNRVHPDGKGAVNPLVAEIATTAVTASETSTGIDVLRAESFERLRGAKIGLVTNQSARSRDGTSTIDAFRAASPVALRAIFTPEHGLFADREGAIKDGAYEGIPIYSLYGERMSPADKTLDGLDTLVVDLQDVGVRFYTYASTMKRAMRVAAARKLRFVVLDRPNPIDGVDVQGPMLAVDPSKSSFVNHHALPIRHGMTMGELARLFAHDDQLDPDFPEVVRMRGWHRKQWFDTTGLAWQSPSPNLRSVRSVVLYPAIGLLEGTNVSVGRGTDTPFEIVAAPWMKGTELAASLTAAAVPGVAFEPVEVTPKASVHAGKKCRGVRVRVTDRARFDPMRAGLAIARALRELHPVEWDFDALDKLLQDRATLEALRSGASYGEIEASWRDALSAFQERRALFLLYR